ncbi:MAG: response regulator [Chitinophagaceae bacterium]
MHPTEVEILLIEDNHDEAALTIRGLRKQNLANNLLHLDDGEEALEFIFGEGRYKEREVEFRPKLILLDLKLPKVDGLSILRRLKENESTRSIPVVILTSSKEESDIVESYKLGVNSYIVKPVNFESFSKAVAELGFYWLLLNEKSEK